MMTKCRRLGALMFACSLLSQTLWGLSVQVELQTSTNSLTGITKDVTQTVSISLQGEETERLDIYVLLSASNAFRCLDANGTFLADNVYKPLATGITISSYLTPQRVFQGTLDLPASGEYAWKVFVLPASKDPQTTNALGAGGASFGYEANVPDATQSDASLEPATWPAIDITANITSGKAPLTVQFSVRALEEGYSFEYNWDMNSDGIPERFYTGSSTAFTFFKPGTYTVSAYVPTPTGPSPSKDSIRIEVLSPSLDTPAAEWDLADFLPLYTGNSWQHEELSFYYEFTPDQKPMFVKEQEKTLFTIPRTELVGGQEVFYLKTVLSDASGITELDEEIWGKWMSDGFAIAKAVIYDAYDEGDTATTTTTSTTTPTPISVFPTPESRYWPRRLQKDVPANVTLTTQTGETLTHTVTALGTEKITVPAGTFDTLKLHISQTGSLAYDTEESYLWITKGVGEIRELSYWEPQSGTSMSMHDPEIRRLLAYHIENSTSPVGDTGTTGTTGTTGDTGTTGTTVPAVETTALSVSVRSGQAPLDVTFSVTQPPEKALHYLWDFDGDGVVDLATALPQATHRYGEAGTFIAAVLVDAEATRTRLTTTVEVTSATGAPTIESVSASPATGEAPLETTLTVNATAGNTPILRYAWDLNNDREVDRITETPTLSIHFPTPGTYAVRVVAIDTDHLVAKGSTTVTVTAPTKPGGRFIFPENGQVIGGTRLTLEYALTASVRGLQFLRRRKDQTDWRETPWLTRDQAEAFTRLPFDTTEFPDGEIELAMRLIGNDDTVLVTPPITVTINNTVSLPTTGGITLPSGMNVFEAINERGDAIRAHRIPPSLRHTFAVGERSRIHIEVPPQALGESDQVLTLREINPEELRPRTRGARGRTRSGAGLTGVELTTESSGSFSSPLSIELPYIDGDGDGTVDSAGVSTSDLGVFMESDTGSWEEIPSTLDTEAQTLTADVTEPGTVLLAPVATESVSTSVTLSMSDTALRNGETHNLLLTLTGTDTVDLYIAVFLPDGSYFCLKSDYSFNDLNVLAPTQSNWAIQSASAESILSFTTTDLPSGTYQWWAVVVPPGADIFSTTWTAYSVATWTFTP